MLPALLILALVAALWPTMAEHASAAGAGSVPTAAHSAHHETAAARHTPEAGLAVLQAAIDAGPGHDMATCKMHCLGAFALPQAAGVSHPGLRAAECLRHPDSALPASHETRTPRRPPRIAV